MQMDFYLKQKSVGETTYLVIDMDDNIAVDSFAMQMMAHNRIGNLVPTQMVRMNDKSQIQFDITGLMKLNNRISVPRPKREVLGLLGSILNAFEEVDAYMLDMGHLFLDWEYVYLDRQGNCMLMYLPFEHTSGKDKIAFLQEIVSRIQPDYQERDPYLFHIMNAFSRGAILKLSDFREILKKSANTQESSLPREGAAATPKPDQEAAGSQPKSQEKKAIPETAEKKPVKKPSSASKIPVVNIPGREPGGTGGKETPKVLPQPEEKKEPKKKEKKGFFKKEKEKQNFFAIPKKNKGQAADPDAGGSKAAYAPQPADGYGKSRTDIMYESYENTVIMQEPVFIQGREEGTVTLDQPGPYAQIPAKLTRQSNRMAYSLAKERMTVGSGAAADICIFDNPAISRNHATIAYINGNYYVEDNRSKNGSFINGRRLQPAVRELLCNGMVLKLANEEFEFFKDPLL